MRASEVLLGGSVAFVFYSYCGYPFLLGVLAWIRKRAVHKGDVEPSVSLIIAAHNEGPRIRDKLENTLRLAYPEPRLEIIVTSDGSVDGTDAIVAEYGARGVRLVRTPERRGKEAAQGLAIESATGQILAFSDTATILPENSIREIARNFADPSVGCVSSVDRLITEEGAPAGEGAYVRYEMLLRRLETRVGSVVGLSGSFFAARREVCRPWRSDLQSDFNTISNTVRQGLRGVSDPDSIACYRSIADPSREYDRKVRTVLRGITVLASQRSLLNPFRYGLFSWQLLSHKLCRWLVPFAMILALVANIALAREPIYGALLVAQLGFYGLAICGGAWPRVFHGPWFVLPWFLVQVNASILHAWYAFARGRRIQKWTPSTRPPMGGSRASGVRL